MLRYKTRPTGRLTPTHRAELGWNETCAAWSARVVEQADGYDGEAGARHAGHAVILREQTDGATGFDG
jgi:hypothetical protein